MHALGIFLVVLCGEGGREGGRKRRGRRRRREVVGTWVRWGVGGLVVLNVGLALLAVWGEGGGEGGGGR
jgi:hypothetical protein